MMKMKVWLLAVLMVVSATVLMVVSAAASAVYIPPTTDNYRLRMYTFTLVTNEGQWIRFDTRPGGLWYGRTVDTDLFADMENLCAQIYNTSQCTLVNHDLTLTPRRGVAPAGHFAPAPVEPASVTAPTADVFFAQ